MTTLNDLARSDPNLANNPYLRNMSTQSNSNNNSRAKNKKKSSHCVNPNNQWVIDLLQQKSKKQSGHKQYHQNAYTKAIKNIKKYPFKITNEHNAQEIDGVGPSMAKLIKSKLLQRDEYISQDTNQQSFNARHEIEKQNKNIQKAAKSKTKKNTNKRKKTNKQNRAYIPRIRTGGWALLVHMYDMYKNNDIQGFLKQQLLTDAQQYCDSSFTEAKNKHYTAWKSMTKLIEVEYVTKINRGTCEYRLTPAGLSVAQRLHALMNGDTIPPKPDQSIFDNNNNNNNNNNNIDDHLRSNNHRHHKSRSHVLMQSPTSISRSKSPSHSQNINGYNSNKYTGICPHCNHESPLLDYIIPSNRHSYLAELRDKLAAIESISSMLKQEILQVQSKSNLSGSDGNLHSASSINNKKNKNHHKKKEVSNPYQNDGHIGSSYLLINLTTQQQQALSLLTTQKKITFPLKGTAMISPQENTPYFDKFKEMRKNFGSQEFFIGLDSETRTFTVHTKYKNNDSKGKDKNTKQYRQIRSFSSLNGAEFESAKDNVLKIWFKNTRGYFLISFASETEANTVLSLVNIIVNNSELSSDIGHQLIWASYIEKKGKRLGFYSQKFVCLISPTNIKLYKTHINYNNGEEPSQLINLMECDLSRDKKEIKFNDKNKNQDNNNKKQPLLSIKLIIEVERDDFLNLCAQTLGKAIQSSMGINVQSPSTTMSVAPDNNNNAMKDSNSWNLAERDEDMSGTDAEDSEYYMDEHKRGYSINDGDNDNIYIDDDDDLLAFKSMTMTLRGPPQINLTNNNKLKKNNAIYLEILNNTPRMYGAGLHKALDRLAKKRPSDIDFIEIQHQFDGNEIIYMNMNINSNERKKRESNTYKLLDVLGKSMISGAFLNKKLYLHKAVWEQNKVMVVNYEKKLEIFNIILLSLDKLFKTDNISIDWLKSDFKNNCNIFHNKLTKCEKKLRDVQNILTDMIEKSKQKAREKGAAKLLNKFKEKTKVKVFDNQPYRDLIYKICGHASSMQLYYIYLNKTNTNNNSFSSETKMLLNDIKGITLCMN
eukprot:20740_1